MRKIISVFLIFLMLNTQIGCALAWSVSEVGGFGTTFLWWPIAQDLANAKKIIENTYKSIIKFFNSRIQVLNAYDVLPWFVKPTLSFKLIDFASKDLFQASKYNKFVATGVLPPLFITFMTDQMLNMFGGIGGYIKQFLGYIQSVEHIRLPYDLIKHVKFTANGIYVPWENLKRFILAELLLMYVGVHDAFSKIMDALVQQLGGYKEALVKIMIASPQWIKYVLETLPTPHFTFNVSGLIMGEELLLKVVRFIDRYLPDNLQSGVTWWLDQINNLLNRIFWNIRFYWISPLTKFQIQQDLDNIVKLPIRYAVIFIRQIYNKGVELAKGLSKGVVLNYPEWNSLQMIVGAIFSAVRAVIKKFGSYLVTLDSICVSYYLAGGLPSINDILSGIGNFVGNVGKWIYNGLKWIYNGIVHLIHPVQNVINVIVHPILDIWHHVTNSNQGSTNNGGSGNSKTSPSPGAKPISIINLPSIPQVNIISPPNIYGTLYEYRQFQKASSEIYQSVYKVVDIILKTMDEVSGNWSLQNVLGTLAKYTILGLGVGMKWARGLVNLILEIPKMTEQAKNTLWMILKNIKYGIDGIVWALRNYIFNLLFKPLLDWVHSVLNGLLNGIKMVFKSGVEWMDKYILYPVQKFGVYLNNEIRSWFGMDVGYVIVGR